MFIKNLKKSLNLSFTLIKILLPLSIIITFLRESGLIDIVSKLFIPIAKLTGLSGELALVWITGMLTNIYGAMLALANLSQTKSFTIAEMTTLAFMILIAHSMFIETAILKKAKGKILNIVFTRIISALIAGFILNLIFNSFSLFDTDANIIWKANNTEFTLFNFISSQIKSYVTIFFVIFILLNLMDFLEKIGLMTLLHKTLSPLLKIMGISNKAVNINLVALTMGISYGGALLIDESNSGNLSSRDINYSIIFVSLCHALIEDSLLMITIGANFMFISFGRFLFALLVVLLVNFVNNKLNRKKFIRAKQ